MAGTKIQETVDKHLRQIRRRAYLKFVLYGISAAIISAHLIPYVYYSYRIPFYITAFTVVLGSIFLVLLAGRIPLFHYKETAISKFNRPRERLMENPIQAVESLDYWKSKGFDIDTSESSKVILRGYPSLIHDLLNHEIEFEIKVVQKTDDSVSIDKLENGRLVSRSRLKVKDEGDSSRVFMETISTKRVSLDFILFYELLLPQIVRETSLNNEVEDEIIEEEFWVSLVRPSFEVEIDPPGFIEPENID